MPTLRLRRRTRWWLLATAAGLTLVAAAVPYARELAGAVDVPADAGHGSVYALTVTDLMGRPAPLGDYAGQVALIVNVASECGFAVQYPDIEALYRRYQDRGFVVLGFPSNDFGGQEPGTADDIRRFCDIRGVTFPVFARTRVRTGAGQSPVYALLGATGYRPRWNFAKYLVGRDGRPRAYFGSFVAPTSPGLEAAIEAALAE